jgi:hypothetical protein
MALIFIYFGGVTNLVIVSAILECMVFLTDETLNQTLLWVSY